MPVKPHRKVYLWNRVNFDEVRSKFTNLSQEFINHHTIDTPIEDLWNSICHIPKSVLNECVPSKIITGTPKKPWKNRKVKQLRRRKQKQYNLAKQTNLDSHWKYYKILKKLMQKECRKAYNDYMHHMVYDPYQNGRKKKFFNK